MNNVFLTDFVQSPGSSPNIEPETMKRIYSNLCVTEDYVRLSVGLEAIEDILEDIDQALKKAVA